MGDWWSRLGAAIHKFPKKWSKDPGRRKLSDFRRCPLCGRFMNEQTNMTTMARILFEFKTYPYHHTDVYNPIYSKEITWTPSIIMHPSFVFWCQHCGIIIIWPDLEG